MKITAQAGSDYPGVQLSIDQGAWLGCALRQARINGWRGRASPPLPVPLALAPLMLAQPHPSGPLPSVPLSPRLLDLLLSPVRTPPGGTMLVVPWIIMPNPGCICAVPLGPQFARPPSQAGSAAMHFPVAVGANYGKRGGFRQRRFIILPFGKSKVQNGRTGVNSRRSWGSGSRGQCIPLTGLFHR